jgi:hypothetical protein
VNSLRDSRKKYLLDMMFFTTIRRAVFRIPLSMYLFDSPSSKACSGGSMVEILPD